MTVDRWTEAGLVEEVRTLHATMQDRRFAFVLGAGASFTSGIPLGGDLARRWVEELFAREGSGSLEAWATGENLRIPGFSWADAPTFYPQLFERRYARPEEGFAALEHVMRGARPSVGYFLLGQMLATKRHNVVITTNFDNLVSDALGLLGHASPLVCGHESLSGFVQANLRRPLVAKIHRDLLLAPVNDTAGTARLAKGWSRALGRLLSVYTPIFIGYGGNDGSLMGFLDKLPPGSIPGRPVWCYWHRGAPPEAAVRWLKRHQGVLVPIFGFDELMVRLSDALGFPLLDAHLERRSQQLLSRYREQVRAVADRLGRAPSLASETAAIEAVRAAAGRSATAWAAQLLAELEPDDDRREAQLRAAIASWPDDPRLRGALATFLAEVRGDGAAADAVWREAIARAPRDPDLRVGHAAVLAALGEREAAEAALGTALSLDTEHVGALHARATLAWDAGEPAVVVAAHFLQARAVGVADADLLVDHGVFLLEVARDPTGAEAAWRAALGADPDHLVARTNLAELLLRSARGTEALAELEELAVRSGPDRGRRVVGLLLEALAGGDGERCLLAARALLPLPRPVRWSGVGVRAALPTALSAVQWEEWEAVLATARREGRTANPR